MKAKTTRWQLQDDNYKTKTARHWQRYNRSGDKSKKWGPSKNDINQSAGIQSDPPLNFARFPAIRSALKLPWSMPNCCARWKLLLQLLLRLYKYEGTSERTMINLAISSKTAVEDTAMMLVTGLTSRMPFLRCDEVAHCFRPVTDNYPICYNDWPLGVSLLDVQYGSFLCGKNGREKNTIL